MRKYGTFFQHKESPEGFLGEETTNKKTYSMSVFTEVSKNTHHFYNNKKGEST